MAKVKSHPLVYTYIVTITTYNKTTKLRERERERGREILQTFLLGERRVCLGVSVGAQENGFICHFWIYFSIT